jgi:translation elongation factor EF-1beta
MKVSLNPKNTKINASKLKRKIKKINSIEESIQKRKTERERERTETS